VRPRIKSLQWFCQQYYGETKDIRNGSLHPTMKKAVLVFRTASIII
jgi:hypothetical protein